MMVNGLVVAMLLVESVEDIRTRSISVMRQLVFLLVGVLVNIIFAYQPLWSVLGGMALGAGLFLVAYITREGIGYGDCMVFVVLGTFVGLLKNIRLLLVSLIVAAVVGVVIMIAKKKNMKMQIPFLPCVLVAFVLVSIIDKYIGGVA